MAASQAAIQRTLTAAEMTATMEAHAASGDWERVEEILVKLRAAVLEVPERERRDTVLAIRRSVEKVQGLAQSARNDVTGKLSQIRRGRDATKAYSVAD